MRLGSHAGHPCYARKLDRSPDSAPPNAALVMSALLPCMSFLHRRRGSREPQVQMLDGLIRINSGGHTRSPRSVHWRSTIRRMQRHHLGVIDSSSDACRNERLVETEDAIDLLDQSIISARFHSMPPVN